MFCIEPDQTIPSAVVVQPPLADVLNRTDVEMPPFPGLYMCNTLQLNKIWSTIYICKTNTVLD